MANTMHRLRSLVSLSRFLCAAVALTMASSAGPVAASSPAPAPHKLGESYVFLQIYDDVVEGRFEIPVKDLETVLKLGLADPQSADTQQVGPYLDRIHAYVAQHFEMVVDGVAAEVSFSGYAFRHIEVANYVMLEFRTQTFAAIPREIEVRFDPFFDNFPRYKALLLIEKHFRSGTFENGEDVALVFLPSNRRQELDLSRSSLWQGFAAFVRSGVYHIWIGFDHILFLLALVLPSVVRRDNRTWEARPSFSEAFIYVVKIVTLFTIAHSVTLALASLEIMNLPSRLVETVIAASVAAAAADILYPILGKRIMLVVFLFGLFHGFGFASNLSDIGLTGQQLVLALVGFNVGVEIGQVGIICVAFPVLFAIRKSWLYRRVLLPGGATVFVLIATMWFVERAFELNIPVRTFARAIVGG